MSFPRIVHGFAGAALAVPARETPRRLNVIAVGLGVAAAIAAVALFAPQIGRVIAEDDAGARAFLRSDAARRPAYAAPIWRSTPAPPAATVNYAPAQRAPGPAMRAIDGVLTPAALRLRPVGGAPRARKNRPSSPLAAAGPVSTGSPLGRRSVCVRLCDGFHFPLGGARGEADLAGQAGMCGQLCPGAPTRLFVIPEGSEKIEDALARDGKKYAALPVAFRHLATRDNTCSCRKPGEETSATMRLLDDLTLRRGDGVMTEAGLRVFRGATRWPLRKRDFARVNAIDLPKPAISALAAVDRAGRRPPPASRQTPIAATPRPVPVVQSPGVIGKQVRLVPQVPETTLLR